MTLDFDGSCLSTTRHEEETAAGFDKIKKGARSYYPLFCTEAQTGQFLARLHRPGNVHDSSKSVPFMSECITFVQQPLPKARIEVRVDCAFADTKGMQFFVYLMLSLQPQCPLNASLYRRLKSHRSWHGIASMTADYCVLDFRAHCWMVPTNDVIQVIAYRKKQKKQLKDPIQLALFIPDTHEFSYRLIVTNKSGDTGHILHFHNGRDFHEKTSKEGNSSRLLGLLRLRF